MVLLVACPLLVISSGTDKPAPDEVASSPASGRTPRELFASARPSNFSALLVAPLAATITVNSTLQSPGASGDCTLGEAILAANANGPVDGCTPGTPGGFDTIMLPAGIYNLTTVNNTNPRVGPVGLPLILSDIIIQGADAATTIIKRDPNATADFGLLALLDNPIGSLVLNDVTVRGGRGFGQAIGLQRGGGLYVGNRTVVLNRVNFDDNIATQGGAIGSFGFATVTANNCTFNNNRATNSVGGAIEARTLTVTHSTFTGNRALTDGGAINFIAGSAAIANISDSVFINNSVDVGNGGAVRLWGEVTISGSTFDGNSGIGIVGTGGAIEAIGTVNISDSSITNNRARDAGGGIYTGGAVYSITRTNISNNTTLNRGGGLYITDGGATSTGAISNSTISNNTAGIGVSDGGGIYVSNAKALTFANVTIEGNNARRDGGGIYYFAGNDTTRVVTLNNVTLSGNHADRDGGGLYRYDGGDIRFKNTIIALNTSSINSGHDMLANLLTSLGYNLVGIKNGANFINTTGDLTGTAAAPLNPLLGPLQANGGPTLTRALLDGSPAMDTANPTPPGSGGNSCEALDQRGTTRPQDGDGNGSQICDIGAVEKGAPPVGNFQLGAATYTVLESNSELSVEVQRVDGSAGAASISFATVDQTAASGADYVPVNTTIDFANGETSKTVNLIIEADALDEPDEIFQVSLFGPTNNAGLGTPISAVVTITDDDAAPTISVDDISVVEGDNAEFLAAFTVSLSKASGRTITVDYSTADGSATAASNDYLQPSPTTLTFPPEVTSVVAQVQVNGDLIIESDENFFINLSNATESSIADGQAQCTILNDDAAPTPTPSPSPTPTLPCVNPPAGIVNWWPFDGNGNNLLGGSAALLSGNPAFADSLVRKSMSFDGTDDHARVPASPAIDVGTGDGFTVEGWINPTEILTARPLIEWNNGTDVEGAHLWLSADFAVGGRGPGSLFVNITDTSQTFHIFSTPPFLVVPNAWQHVALTYDKTTGLATIYLNGAFVTQQNLGTFTPQTGADLYFGYRPVGVLAGRRFLGGLDEVGLFNRALSPSEIQTIFNASGGGKCPPVAISILEIVTVSDGPVLLPALMIGVNEQISVLDTPSLLRSAMISVNEQISVLDAPALRPSLMIGINEQISVLDTPSLLRSAMIAVNEQINVFDAASVLPPVTILVAEQISVTDAPSVVTPTPIPNPARLLGPIYTQGASYRIESANQPVGPAYTSGASYRIEHIISALAPAYTPGASYRVESSSQTVAPAYTPGASYRIEQALQQLAPAYTPGASYRIAQVLPQLAPAYTAGASYLIERPIRPLAPAFTPGASYVVSRPPLSLAAIFTSGASYQISFDFTATLTTPIGNNVSAKANGVGITFAKVSRAGTTTVKPADPKLELKTPSEFGELARLSIATTAATTGPVTTCFDLPSSIGAEAFSRLRLLAVENSQLVDRTTLSGASDTQARAARTICAKVDTLGPMVIATLVGPQGTRRSVLDDLVVLRATISNKADQEKFDEVVGHLTNSIAPRLWVDPYHLNATDGEKVFDEDKQAIDWLLQLMSERTSASAELLQVLVDRIARVELELVQVAIEDAKAATGDQSELAKAIEEFNKGDVAKVKTKNDVDHYRAAWKHAVLARRKEQ
jgi:hypothetical protein